jgi:hypothetical protein
MIQRFLNNLRELNQLPKRLESLTRINEIIQGHINRIACIEGEKYRQLLFSTSKYKEGKRLEPYGFKVYSQCDEDGIIQEIFNRIGIANKRFVEFGVGNGMENNTLKLLLEGWSGLWIEGNEDYVKQIQETFRDIVDDGRLMVKAAFITRDNINNLIAHYFTGEIDLLSIDIDGNDIYVLDAINVIRPRVIITEYNGKLPPPISVAQRYNPNFKWDGSDYSGSSLKAITKIAASKGYSLVGCNVVGVNAFFVRDELAGDHFQAPFTAENHYQPTRYFLWQTFSADSGHPTGWGPYDRI